MKAPSLLLLSILLIIPCIGIAADRTVLCEYFTSTTCPPCKTANQYFDSWLSTFTDKNRIAVVKYHVWWPSPGNDPYYLSNTSEPRSRTSYYGVNAVPNMRIDGVNCGYTYSSWPGTITSSMAATSPLAMSISGTLNSSGGTITVSVTAENNATIPSGEIILQVALTESHLQYTGPNGDPVHESVMRKMYPDGNGEVFAIQPGQTKTFQRAIALNGGWIAANCEIVAFVQSNNVQ
jgi:hypothetical protein